MVPPCARSYPPDRVGAILSEVEQPADQTTQQLRAEWIRAASFIITALGMIVMAFVHYRKNTAWWMVGLMITLVGVLGLLGSASQLEPARGLYWYAAHAFDHLREEAERAAALAKAHITDRAMQIARDAVEVHGGIGFTWECDVQIWFKRAIFDRAFLGIPSLHRERAAQLAGW